jgi:hypothetical protein
MVPTSLKMLRLWHHNTGFESLTFETDTQLTGRNKVNETTPNALFEI